MNLELVGTLTGGAEVERSPRGVRRPAWFQDVTLDDIDEMARTLQGRGQAR